MRKLGSDIAVKDENCPMPWTSSCDTSQQLHATVIAAIRDWIDMGTPGCESRPDGVPLPMDQGVQGFWANTATKADCRSMRASM